MMHYSSRNLTVLALATVLVVCCLASLAAGACSGDKHKVDSLILAMTWQPGACKSGKVKCTKGFENVFSIHGFWPQKKDGNLEYCCTNDFYLEKKISTLKRSLRANWPSLFGGREDAAWEYQYNKHGSCAIGKVAGAKDIKEYFSRAVHEFSRFELGRVLQEGGYKIKTSAQYYGSDIIRYLRDEFNHDFQLVCESKGQNKIVTEIRACFDANLRQIDCAYTKRICKGPVTFQ